MRLLIINADDFGKDSEVNQAVIEAFRSGLCSSATLMVNMPGFEEACELFSREDLAGCVGVHLVLRDGLPLTDPIRKFPRFCDPQGRLCLARQGVVPHLFLSGLEKRVLAQEIRAQIGRCRSRGIEPTHLDSHYDLHMEWGVAEVLLQVVRKEGIPYVRIARNCGRGLHLAKRFYKTLFNRRLTRAGVARTRFRGSVADYEVLRERFTAQGRELANAIDSFEVMVHPRFGPDGVLRDDSDGRPLKIAVGLLDGFRKAVSFGGRLRGGSLREGGKR